MFAFVRRCLICDWSLLIHVPSQFKSSTKMLNTDSRGIKRCFHYDHSRFGNKLRARLEIEIGVCRIEMRLWPVYLNVSRSIYNLVVRLEREAYRPLMSVWLNLFDLDFYHFQWSVLNFQKALRATPRTPSPPSTPQFILFIDNFSSFSLWFMSLQKLFCQWFFKLNWSRSAEFFLASPHRRVLGFI